MLGALAGIGGMALLFGEAVKQQAETQARSNLYGKANAIASVTDAAETLASGLAVSVTTLQERGAQFPATYAELTGQLFDSRPSFVTGLGFGQRENGIIADQPWLFPYYWAFPTEDVGVLNAEKQYEDFADDEGEFYPDSERYSTYFEPQEETWTTPETAQAGQVVTYYRPMFESGGRWIGTALVDVDAAYLTDLLDEAVFRNQGYFVMLNQAGEVIANPEAPESQTYEDIGPLQQLWPNLDTSTSGMIETRRGYWYYAPVPGQEWVLLGFLPYQAIFGRLVLITAISMTIVVALLSAAIAIALGRLNQVLSPILAECRQRANLDEALTGHQGKVKQISDAFFTMLDTLDRNAEALQQQEQALTQKQQKADQVTEQFLQFAAKASREGSKQQTITADAKEQAKAISLAAEKTEGYLRELGDLGQSLEGSISLTDDSSDAQLLTAIAQNARTLTAAVETMTQYAQGQKQMATLAKALGTGIAALRLSDGQEENPATASILEQAKQLSSQAEEAIRQQQDNLRRVQTLTEAMLTDVTKLKDSHRQRPVIEDMQQQARRIVQVAASATQECDSVAAALISMEENLQEIGQVSADAVKRASVIAK